MPALFGYLVALSILLGGGYAGLQWLALPDPRPAVKPAAHSKNIPDKSAPTTTGTAVGPSEADAKRNSGTGAKSASTEGSAKPAHDAKETEAKGSGKDPKAEKADSVPAGGCAPIGLTSNGDLVYSMRCQDLIERHRAELASTQPPQSGPAGDQAAQSTKPTESAKATENTRAVQPESPNNAGEDGKQSDTAARSEVRPSTPKGPSEIARSESNESSTPVQPKPSNKVGPDSRRKDAAARGEKIRPSTAASAEPEVARSETNESSNRAQAKPSDHNRTGKARSNEVRAAEIKPNNPIPDIDLTTTNSGQQKRSPPSKPVETTSKTTEPAAPSREQRSPPIPRPRVAARAETEWYNVLGLR
jgi:hypothetical protein